LERAAASGPAPVSKIKIPASQIKLVPSDEIKLGTEARNLVVKWLIPREGLRKALAETAPDIGCGG
jgi:hypothetical protein